MQIVGAINGQIHLQYEIDVEFMYQISILPVTPNFYLIIDTYFPEYAKVQKTNIGWKMTSFCDSVSDCLLEAPEYDLTYPYTLEKIGTFYEDNFDIMMEMSKLSS